MVSTTYVQSGWPTSSDVGDTKISLPARCWIKRPACLTSLLICILASAPARAADDTESVGLTVYNQDFAIIREHRSMTLPAGRSEVKFKDVAATIVPESVQFRSLQPADAAIVIEQNFAFDLVSAARLLDKYIDRPIELITRDGDVLDGNLLSFDESQLVLAGDDGIQLVPRGENVRDVRFSKLPGGLLTRPTLVWLIDAADAGDHIVEVAYRANQVNWNVDYRARADADGKNIDLSGWVTITNRSGLTYENAKLKLMAGDVHVVKEDERERGRLRGDVERLSMARKRADFEEKAFAEYHLYELPRPATIKDNQTKQIELVDITGIPVERTYQFRSDENKVRVILEFKNAKETHPDLAIPLPKGPVRVYQTDADGASEFIGSDAIDHTPKNEPVKIKLGYAFDIAGERVQTDERRPGGRVREQDWRIRIRNHKDTDVAVEIVELLHARWNWTILANSHDFEKKDHRTIAFKVDVPSNGETEMTYTVRYTW